MAPGTGLHFDPLRAIPNVAFRDTTWFEAELDNIWHDDWVFVATEQHLAQPGDQVPVMVGRQPVLVLRNESGELVAVSNLCAHRGTLLVEESTNAKRIQCPYHAWTYADSGRLLSVPFSPKGEIDKAEHCLPTYRVESWHGLIFVSLNPDIEPLTDRFAAVDAVLGDHEPAVDTLHHWPPQEEPEIWNCNWKLAMFNAMESYHLFHVHPETLEPYTPTKDAYYISGSARSTATANPGNDGSLSILISLPPNFVGVLGSYGLIWLAVDPLATDRCLIRTGAAFTSAPPDPDAGRLKKMVSGAASAAYAMAVPDFLPEDRAICERGQRGAAGDYRPGRLLDVERVVIDFGHYLAWRLHGTEPPPPFTNPDA